MGCFLCPGAGFCSALGLIVGPAQHINNGLRVGPAQRLRSKNSNTQIILKRKATREKSQHNLRRGIAAERRAIFGGAPRLTTQNEKARGRGATLRSNNANKQTLNK